MSGAEDIIYLYYRPKTAKLKGIPELPPDDFMFALTRDDIMRISQIVTSSDIKYAKRVRAFTEQSADSVSWVLNGKGMKIEQIDTKPLSML